MNVAALLTCHNRKRSTEQCLTRLFAQRLPRNVRLRAYVTDDGSTDGTFELLQSLAPRVVVIRGTGQLYWCGGMRRAWRAAARDDPDHYLLLNDDTLLEPDGVEVLLETAQAPDARRIAVGAIRDPDTGRLTYGGVRSASGNFEPRGEIEPCDTFNANAVLITRAVYCEIGMFHDAYTHAMGDYDYGYQARRRGIATVQTPRYVGSCRRNPLAGSWRDRTLTRAERLRILRSPKGLPFREWALYNRRNAGWRWPLRSVSPYVRVLLGL
ncbi:MAG: glycosyltransferase family 2 protein [Gammaproteobacteria bacterium]|nr:glycosyltransferase family 2 protein [Gammaproteobacteria bacterium]